MDENIIPHFSKKILLLSVIFLILNISWYVLTVFSQQSEPFRTVAPKLSFVEVNDVQLKTKYDEEFHLAEVNQALISGTTVSTGDLEYAEIILENNVLRLDENTQITLLENNFATNSTYEPGLSRLVLSLDSGNVWVNAFDRIEIITPRSSASFAHSVGYVSYNEPINRLMVVTGSADLDLFDEKGSVVTSYTVPLYNQITYLDTQIIDEYAKIRESKLKKELKVAPIASTILENEWVIRNSEVDSDLLDLRKKFVNSKLSYSIKIGYNKLRSVLTFTPQSKRKLAVGRAEIILGYLLGGLQRDGNIEEAKLVLNDLKEVIDNMQSDPLIKELFVSTFFAIGPVEMNSPAHIIKEELLSYMLFQDGPYVLRSYLTDLRVSLEKLNLDDAEKVASDWLEKWNAGLLAKNIEEFTKQAKMLHRTILTYSDRATAQMLATLDESGQKRLDSSDDIEETRYSVAEERLEMSSALVADYRYLAAKQYLRDSYESLGIDETDSSSQASQIFTEMAQILAQRIEFAEDRMHGASESIDESEFREYIQLKTRDELLSENLKEFLQVGIEPEEATKPELDDVIERFTSSRVIIIDSDIVVNKDSPFTFEILKARLMERASDGSQVLFSAVYDYTTNAVNDVVVGDTRLKGNFGLSDLVAIIGDGKKTEEAVQGADILDLLEGGKEDEALRAQATAQELAKQLVQNELLNAGITIGSLDTIEVLDVLTLTKFKIHEAFIPNPEDPSEPLIVDFEYNSSSKKASSIHMSDVTIEQSTLEISQLSDVITGGVVDKSKKEFALEQFIDDINSQNLLIEKSDVTVLADYNIEFKNLIAGSIPVNISGTYNTQEKKFTSFSSDIYEASGVSQIDYFNKLGLVYIAGYLADKEIIVYEDQINASYPFDEIEIDEYIMDGNSYTFEVDIIGAKLKNIKNTETEKIIDKMSFGDFLNMTSASEEEPAEEPEEEKYKYTSKYYEEKAYVIDFNNNYFHIDIDGNRYYEENYAEVDSYVDGLSAVKDFEDNWFHIDHNGDRAYENNFSFVGGFYEDRCRAVDLEGNWFHIMIDGERAYSENYTKTENYINGYAKVWDEDGNQFYIDLNGNEAENL